MEKWNADRNSKLLFLVYILHCTYNLFKVLILMKRSAIQQPDALINKLYDYYQDWLKMSRLHRNEPFSPITSRFNNLI